MNEDTRELVARICHEVNRAYCISIGDNSQKPWDEAPQWQKDATAALLSSGERTTGEQRHEQWTADMVAAGWKHGPVKNGQTKEHPDLVPWAELPESARTKDALLNAVVDSYLRA